MDKGKEPEGAAAALAGLQIKIDRPVPPTPKEEPEEEDDEDNPFADSNEAATPMVEKHGMNW